MSEKDENLKNRSLELCRRVVTTGSFIAEAKEIYGDRYDYGKVEYKNRDHRVTIVCPVHGDFQVYAREHLDGKGCPKCEKGKKFLAKLKEKFGDKFGLEEFVYESSTLPVTLICPTHGAFSRLPHQILNLQFGCPMCGSDAKDEIHNAAVARKEEIKKQKQKEREVFEAQRLNNWLQEREKRRILREKAMKDLLSGHKSLDFYYPFQIYQQSVDEHIEGIRYGGWKTEYYKAFKLDEEEARKLKYFREGDTFYMFPNEAPSQDIIDDYEQYKPYYGEGEDRVTFEEHLSHRGITVFFHGKDLLLREDRYNSIHNLTEENLRSAIDFVKTKYHMNEDNARIYIFPYGSMEFFISESFEKLSGRSDHRKESNWITFPLTTDFNYRLLRQECRDYANLHPLEKEPIQDFSIDLEEIVKNALVKKIHEKYGDVSEEEMSNIINQFADNREDEDDSLDDKGDTIEESPVVLEYSSSVKDSFIAIDLETATSERSSICQIGITEVIDGKICKTKSWLVQPEGNRYDSMNIWIHGITPSDTKNSPTFPDVWKEVQPYLQNKIVVAHNTSFDMYALKNAFDKYGMEYPTFDYYCTLRIARYTIKGCYSYSLDVVLNHLGINMGQHHKADSDSRACAMLLLKCLEMDGSTLDDLESKYDFHRGCFAPNKFKAHLKNEKVYKYKSIIESLETNTDLLDENNYFFGKSVCFTGTCKYGVRKDLLQKIKDVGGIPMDSVTKDTNVLVVGQQDYRVVGEDGMSSKQKKALKLLEKGYDIEILSETEFYNRF